LEIAPRLERVVIMFNPDTFPVSVCMPSVETAARSLKVVPIMAPVHNDAEIKQPLSPLGASREAALSSYRTHSRSCVARRSYWQRPETTYRRSITFLSSPETAVCSPYGPDLVDNWRRTAPYVDRILRGAKPAELPVQLPTKFEMVINLKTTKALSLTIPPNLLAVADEVIE
jgi:putative tryptophan/tyrosine transport system substrate-binding protein